MEVLVYHGKNTELFKCSDRLESLWKLFRLFDEMGFYRDVKGDQKTFYMAAKHGDKKAAATLLQVRQGNEYEAWEIAQVK